MGENLEPSNAEKAKISTELNEIIQQVNLRKQLGLTQEQAKAIATTLANEVNSIDTNDRSQVSNVIRLANSEKNLGLTENQIKTIAAGGLS